MSKADERDPLDGRRQVTQLALDEPGPGEVVEAVGAGDGGDDEVITVRVEEVDAVEHSRPRLGPA